MDQDFEVFGESGKQGVRNQSTGRIVIQPEYTIWQFLGPVITGKDGKNNRLVAWNRLGEPDAESEFAFAITPGSDLDELYVFTDVGRTQRRYVYVPERGCLVRMILLDSGNDRNCPVVYRVLDENGRSISGGEGYWYFDSSQ